MGTQKRNHGAKRNQLLQAYYSPTPRPYETYSAPFPSGYSSLLYPTISNLHGGPHLQGIHPVWGGTFTSEAMDELALVDAQSFEVGSQVVCDDQTNKRLVRNHTLPVSRPEEVTISNINGHQIAKTDEEAKIGHRADSRITGKKPKIP